MLGHTRWASIGIISQPNAHPMNSDELGGGRRPVRHRRPQRRRRQLRRPQGRRRAAHRRRRSRATPRSSRRSCPAASPPATSRSRPSARRVGRFDGSVAIAASVGVDAPIASCWRCAAAVRRCTSASPTTCTSWHRSPTASSRRRPPTSAWTARRRPTPSDPAASRGQVVELDGTRRRHRSTGIRRFAYDGTELPVTRDELVTPEVTTRDIDRGESPHFLLKEIGEAPGSFRKTLRGKIAEDDGLLFAELDDSTLPVALRRDLRDGTITRIQVIGQGTAAVAGASLARALRDGAREHRRSGPRRSSPPSCPASRCAAT